MSGLAGLQPVNCFSRTPKLPSFGKLRQFATDQGPAWGCRQAVWGVLAGTVKIRKCVGCGLGATYCPSVVWYAERCETCESAGKTWRVFPCITRHVGWVHLPIIPVLPIHPWGTQTRNLLEGRFLTGRGTPKKGLSMLYNTTLPKFLFLSILKLFEA